MSGNPDPELGRRVRTGAFDSNVHDLGAGKPVLFIHGSGPGVSAWANWRLVMPVLAKTRRVLAPDMVGFGFTERFAPGTGPERYNMDTWVRQALDLLDAQDIARADVVGNSFGGALALALAIRAPQRVRRLVLMGSVGVPFAITPGLDAVWGYQPSFESMRRLMDWFAYDRSRVTDELAQLRYEASIRPGFQESFGAMFPAPRQRWVDAMASPEAAIRSLPHETLVVHGREDQVIPVSTSLRLMELLDNADLSVYSHCGHWSMIERNADFNRALTEFFSG